jgi:hypothetical protein
MTEAERKAAEKELLDSMLETLHNTPLMTENSKGITVNQTPRVFWAIQFVMDVAKQRGIRLEGQP